MDCFREDVLPAGRPTIKGAKPNSIISANASHSSGVKAKCISISALIFLA